MDDEYDFDPHVLTEKGELSRKLLRNYKTLELSDSEFKLIMTLSDYEKAPSARQLANVFGLIRTERIKAMLSRLDSLGFVKTSPDGTLDFSGLHKALDAFPDKSIPSFPDDEAND